MLDLVNKKRGGNDDDDDDDEDKKKRKNWPTNVPPEDINTKPTKKKKGRVNIKRREKVFSR